MPLRQLRTSILARALLLIWVLLLLALFRNFAVLVFTWQGLHDNAAIDTASAISINVNRLVIAVARQDEPQRQLAAAALEHRLGHPGLRRALERPGRGEMRATYQRLQQQWRRELAPALQRGDERAFLRGVGHFVTQLDALTVGLQRQHNYLQDRDFRSFVVTMGILIGLALLTLYFLRRKVDAPLRELLSVTEKFRAGNLDVRVRHQSDDEIGQLASSFNAMADAVATSHRDLEQSVEMKIGRLARANAALELLLQSSHGIAEGRIGAEALEQLAARFQALLPELRLMLCLHPAGTPRRLIAVHGSGGRQICARDDCFGCPYYLDENQQIHEVRSQGEALGHLRAHFPANRVLQPWEVELLRALASLVGSALVLGRQREQSNQLLLLSERSTIARELHDSLAQSLSYMKLQVGRLQALTRRGDAPEQVDTSATELREGLNEAYRQLRELLTTFRLGMVDGELAGAMQDAADEFARRGGYRCTLEAEVLAVPLCATEQIHVLQITREALANCSRHAQAGSVQVRLLQRGEEVELLIEDDGRGIDDDGLREHHGIAIMRERARDIGGTVEIRARQPRGTCVRLCFRPAFLAAGAAGAVA